MMLAALVAATVASQPQPLHTRAVLQATATVRILPAVRIESDNLPDSAIVRTVAIEQPDGSRKPMRLVEFP